MPENDFINTSKLLFLTIHKFYNFFFFYLPKRQQFCAVFAGLHSVKKKKKKGNKCAGIQIHPCAFDPRHI